MGGIRSVEAAHGLMATNMRALIFALILFIASPSQAFNVAMMGGSGASTAGGTCNPATNIIGSNDTSGTDARTSTSGNYYCQLAAADCDGKLESAYVYHIGTVTDYIKTCVYTDDGDNAPDVDDTLLECSGIITGDQDATFETAAFSTTPNVSNGVSYWVCWAADTTGWDHESKASGTAYYQAIGGVYASPPATLTGTWTTLDSRTYPVYAGVQTR